MVIFKKVNMIVSGLNTIVNLHVSLHAGVMNHMLMKQCSNEINDAYLTRYRSMFEILKIVGEEHILVNKTLVENLRVRPKHRSTGVNRSLWQYTIF